MKVMVTAGSTMTMIDQVRGITNIFKGRTGTDIADYFVRESCDVTLITSNLDIVSPIVREKGVVVTYKTYDQLYEAMKNQIHWFKYDVVIHSAAVSDYKPDGVFVDAGNSKFIEIDDSKKIGSGYDEIFLKLIPTRKIVDDLSNLWDFDGYLVKFKLQVGISYDELVEIAKTSRDFSNADYIVANLLDDMNGKDEMYIIDRTSHVEKCKRIHLPEKLHKLLLSDC